MKCEHTNRHTERQSFEDFPLNGEYTDLILTWCADCGEFIKHVRAQDNGLMDLPDDAIKKGII